MAANTEYKAKGFIGWGTSYNNYITYESGWWTTEQQAREELNGIMESKMPAGLYQVAINIDTRTL